MIGKKIPGKLNNRTMVNILERLRKAERLVKRNFTANDEANAATYELLMGRADHNAFLPTGAKAKDDPGSTASELLPLIERQSELKDMSLGKSTLDYSGCEVISVYNMLLRYDGGSHKVPLPELIEIFEKDGIIHAGRFGVSPKAIADYLKSRGLQVNFTTDESDIDVLGYFCDHFILTVMNDREDIFRQIHTFYISKTEEHFIAHNAGLRMRYFSISEIIKALPGGRAKGICLIAVKEVQED